ncbi:urease accessory protein UreD [Propionivibrio limicola]|uniref:urease accessory protein UreD n=1 Tax=Propionivibrio limicola TaxID=167645 RepID=UPI001291A687|nr:urease accessory protein UreD [Propionivibrio limicola]
MNPHSVLQPPTPPTLSPVWHAKLHLGFVSSDGRTVLRENRHAGPLRVQKALHPEGEAVCQAIVLHPPSGIAGGDQLLINVHVGPQAHAQLTTPGAGKWYRSGGADASQTLDFTVADQAILEWLPQETIVFDGAKSRMETKVLLGEGSRYLGWEILCLGRSASGERFDHGHIGLHTRIERHGQPLWLERGRIEGADPMLASVAGWAGASVGGTLLATLQPGDEIAALLETCRSIAPADGAEHALTALPNLLVARYLGHNSEAARLWFAALWQSLRPALLGRPALTPRIWNT